MMFEQEEIYDCLIENFDEIHFILNAETGNTRAVKGSKKIKYLDVVSGTAGFTMVVRLTGGLRGKIAPTLIIFKATQKRGTIRGINDMIHVFHPTAKKAFMTKNVLAHYFSDPNLNRNLIVKLTIVFHQPISDHIAS
ncbi:hypothetical protein GEMRC1_000458 [Eukaryota sp. GEM-RC1]